MVWALVSAAFLQGAIGSTHCIGMCGPFVAILQTREGSGLISNLLYNLGRTISYACIGGILGGLGWGANQFLFKEIASILGGSILILWGIGYLFPVTSNLLRGGTKPGWISGWMARGFRSISSVSLLSFFLGLSSGLLPCGLLLPAYGLALLSGDLWIGSIVMISFSLGTYPMLFAVGIFGMKIMASLQALRTRILIGVSLILFGLFTIWNRVHGSDEDPNCHAKTDQNLEISAFSLEFKR